MLNPELLSWNNVTDMVNISVSFKGGRVVRVVSCITNKESWSLTHALAQTHSTRQDDEELHDFSWQLVACLYPVGSLSTGFNVLFPSAQTDVPRLRVRGRDVLVCQPTNTVSGGLFVSVFHVPVKCLCLCNYICTICPCTFYIHVLDLCVRTHRRKLIKCFWSQCERANREAVSGA